MTRKKFCLFLVFICLFFISFSSVKADDTSSNYYADFTILDTNILNSTFIDENSHISYSLRDIIDLVIDRYSHDYKFMIFLNSNYKSDIFDFMIYKIDSSLTDTDMFFTLKFGNSSFVLRLGSSNVLSSKDFGYKNYTVTGGGLDNNIFSLDRLYSDIDDFMGNSDTTGTLVNHYSSHNLFDDNHFIPYFINFNSFYKDTTSSDIIVRKSSARQIIISNGDSMTPFFLTSSANDLNNDAPFPDISFSDVITDDNNIVTSVTASINFSDFNGAYRNKYSFNNIETTIEEQTSFSITSNGLLSARSCSKTNNICFNKKTYNIDFIGKDKKFFDDFMQDVYFDKLVGVEPVLTSSSGVNDYLNWYVYHFKKTYPIILQLKDLITMFDTRTSSGIHDNHPLPSFNINLGFLGINQNFNIFDLSILFPYKDRIYNLIKYICAIYTFITVINLVKELTDNS